MAREVEAKIKIDNFDALRARLDKLGASYEGECLERNWIFDTHKELLRKRGVLLRVRNTGGAEAEFTVKRKIDGGEFKTREEIESMVDSTDDLLRQMEMLGYHIIWIYEKFRQTWIWRDCMITLDECPEMGCFVEIEGTPDRIRGAAAELGLDTRDHIDDNYIGLWLKYLEARGEKPRNMVFSQDAVRQRKSVTEIRKKTDADSF